MADAEEPTPNQQAPSLLLGPPALLAGAGLAVVALTLLGPGASPRTDGVGWYPAVRLVPQVRSVTGFGASLLLAAVLVAVVAWSAHLVNTTVAAQPARFDALGRRLLGGHRAGRAGQGSNRFNTVGLMGYCGLVALLAFLAWYGPGAYADQLFGGAELSQASVVVFLGATMIATFLVLSVHTEVIERLDSRSTGPDAEFVVLGWTLFVGLGLAVVSYAIGVHPPYVFALVAGYGRWSASGADETGAVGSGGREQAIPVLAGASATFGVCVVAALLASDLGLPNEVDGAGFVGLWAQLAGEAVGATITIGSQALVFALMPFRFLDGHRVRSWNGTVWAGVQGVCLWLFVADPVVSRLGAGSAGAEAARPLALFAVLCLLAVSFRVVCVHLLGPDGSQSPGSVPSAAPPLGSSAP